MKISTKGRYGLKAVMEIARQADNGHVSMRDLSQTTGISASYLEQLFKKLRAAGVLRSVRGAQAVSYTHLDVYKRQGPREKCRFVRW